MKGKEGITYFHLLFFLVRFWFITWSVRGVSIIEGIFFHLIHVFLRFVWIIAVWGG